MLSGRRLPDDVARAYSAKASTGFNLYDLQPKVYGTPGYAGASVRAPQDEGSSMAATLARLKPELCSLKSCGALFRRQNNAP